MILVMASIKAGRSSNFVKMGKDYFQFDINVVELLRFLEEVDDVTATLEARRKVDVELDGLREQFLIFQFVLKILDHFSFSV